jgi:GxxExxY protein
MRTWRVEECDCAHGLAAVGLIRSDSHTRRSGGQEVRRTLTQEDFDLNVRPIAYAESAELHDAHPRKKCRSHRFSVGILRKTAGSFRARLAVVTSDCSSIDELAEKVIGCAIEVHRTLGPGLLESVYRECMILELRRQNLRVARERQIPVDYKGERIKSRLKLDLVVEDCIIVELKAVERLHPIHQAQVITYLKLTGLPAGLLMNFNAPTLKAGLKRLDHPDRYVKKM